MLISCVGSDSIQNYVGAEVIQVKCYNSIDGYKYNIVKLRIKNDKSYNIITINCSDAEGYCVGDTVKLNKIVK